MSYLDYNNYLASLSNDEIDDLCMAETELYWDLSVEDLDWALGLKRLGKFEDQDLMRTIRDTKLKNQ